MGLYSSAAASSLKIMTVKFALAGVTDRKGKDWSSELPNQYLEIIVYPSEEWGVGSGNYFSKGKCTMNFTFREIEGKLLAAPKQLSGTQFVLEPLTDAGNVVGYILRYTEISDTFKATFRTCDSEALRRGKVVWI